VLIAPPHKNPKRVQKVQRKTYTESSGTAIDEKKKSGLSCIFIVTDVKALMKDYQKTATDAVNGGKRDS
jgi:hypothetical protein